MPSDTTEFPLLLYQAPDYDDIPGTEDAEALLEEQRGLISVLLESDEYVDALDRVVNSLAESGNIFICNTYSHGNFLPIKNPNHKILTRIKIAISYHIAQMGSVSPSEILESIRSVKITETPDEYGISFVFARETAPDREV